MTNEEKLRAASLKIGEAAIPQFYNKDNPNL